MKKIILVILLLIVIGIGGVIFWWISGTTPVNPNNKETVVFVIPQGAGLRAIGASLKRDGLIKDDVVFYLLVKQLGYEDKIVPGDFKLSPSMSPSEIAKTLTQGPIDIWITIPEGKRAEEIADILQEKIASYDESWRSELVANEGYLFPDTYLIPQDATIETVISLLTNTFYQKLEEAGFSRNDPSLPKRLTIASLIEREAITNEEKPIIAGIMENRLNEDMALQIDASIQYAKGKQNGNWWAPVTASEYKSVNSPYNTYLIVGIPPTPISNPGIESIKAAFNPADTPYLYYLHDSDGNIRYARTLTEHNANIRRYGVNN